MDFLTGSTLGRTIIQQSIESNHPTMVFPIEHEEKKQPSNQTHAWYKKRT